MADTNALVKEANLKALAVKVDVDRLAANARALDIVDAETYGQASDITKILKAKKAWLDDDRKSLTKPLDDAKTAIMGRYKPQLEEIEILLKELDRKAYAYAAKVEAQRRAEDAKRRAEEQAALEAQKKDILDAAAETGDEALLDAAAEVEAQQQTAKAAPVEIVKAKAAGSMSALTMRDNWHFEVVNEALVPAALKSTDKDKVNDLIKAALKKNEALKGTLEFAGTDIVAGLRIYNTPSSVSR